MSVTTRPFRPTAGRVREDLRFSVGDVARGAAVTVGVFEGLTILVLSVYAFISSLIALPTTFPLEADGGNVVAGIVTLLVALLVVILIVFVSALTTVLLGGPLAWAVSLPLRRVPWVPVHAAAHFLVGVITATALIVLTLVVTGGRDNIVSLGDAVFGTALPWIAALGSMTGVSAVCGWLAAWRHRVGTLTASRPAAYEYVGALAHHPSLRN